MIATDFNIWKYMIDTIRITDSSTQDNTPITITILIIQWFVLLFLFILISSACCIIPVKLVASNALASVFYWVYRFSQPYYLYYKYLFLQIALIRPLTLC